MVLTNCIVFHQYPTIFSFAIIFRISLLKFSNKSLHYVTKFMSHLQQVSRLTVTFPNHLITFQFSYFPRLEYHNHYYRTADKCYSQLKSGWKWMGGKGKTMNPKVVSYTRAPSDLVTRLPATQLLLEKKWLM